VDRSRVAIVIPAYNESPWLPSILSKVKEYGVPIIVDDGSTDNTSKIAIQKGAILVSHDSNLGYDAALNSGFKKASELGMSIVITMDADGQHDPSLLPDFISRLIDGAVVVVGNRDETQRVSECIFSLVTKIRYGLYDPLCGMKAYRIELYKDLGHFDSYKSIGTELTLYAARKKYRIDQIPIFVKPRMDQSRFSRLGSFDANLRILRSMMHSIFSV
jgi:glycosyltransferase involved in cell wall biosynthesis